MRYRPAHLDVRSAPDVVPARGVRLGSCDFSDIQSGVSKGSRKPRITDLVLGPLPVDKINKALGLELEPGDVVLTVGTQRHALKRHPSDYARCQPHVGGVVIDPSYIGDDFENPGKIELVARVPAIGSGLLVAVLVEPNVDGNYVVTSFYPISERTIENRRQNGRLIIPPRN